MHFLSPLPVAFDRKLVSVIPVTVGTQPPLVTPGITCYKFNVDISNSGKKGPVSPAFLPELLVSTLGL